MDDARKRTWAEIDLGRLARNYHALRGLTPPGCRFLGVVKANAYGHGAVPVAKKLEELGADYLAVACLDEALELREAGLRLPILILGVTPMEYAPLLLEHGITQTVGDLETAQALSAVGVSAGRKVKVHIKVDTGMSRLGFLWSQGAEEDIRRVYGLPGLECEGVFTHFANADGDETYTMEQFTRFLDLLGHLERAGVTFPIRHCAASAAVLNYPCTHLDMVRAGNMLYGLYPDSKPAPDGPLAPVMSLYSRVAQVRALPEGASVSYGRTYQAPSPIKTAVVAAGYADGYPRRLSNQAWAVIDGVAYPQIGTICMDAHMLDISHAPQPVQPGDPVLLWGPGGMSVEEVAQAVGTINYELTSLVTKRVPRVYVEEEEA